MKTTIEVNGYEIVIQEADGMISVSAMKDGEIMEEFELESGAQSQGEDMEDMEMDDEGEMKDFDEFGQDEEEEEDFEGQDEEEGDDDDNDDDNDEEEFEEEEEEESEGKLESFQSFLKKRKK